jgi:hypothetical protein
VKATRDADGNIVSTTQSCQGGCGQFAALLILVIGVALIISALVH